MRNAGYRWRRSVPHQMMRICERIGVYDRRKLDMTASVVSKPSDCVSGRQRKKKTALVKA